MLRRFRLPSLAALALLACGGPHGVRDSAEFARLQARADSACTWSPAREVLAGGVRPVYVEYPSAAPVSGGTLLLGSPTIVWGQAHRVAPTRSVPRDSVFPAGVVLRRDGRIDQVPDPSGAMATSGSPRVAALDSAKALAVWEKRALGSVGGASPRQAIWGGIYERGRWRDVQQLFTTSQLDWNNFTSTSALVGARDTFSLVFRDNESRRLTLLRFERGVWNSRVLPFDGSYPRLLDTDRGLLLAYVMPDSAAFDVLWITVSRDRGQTWSAPARVDRARHRFHHDPVLASVGDRVVLIWSEDGSGPSDSIMVSDAPLLAPLDGPWERRTSLHVPDLGVGISAIAVNGNLYVAASARGSIAVASWHPDVWSGVHGEMFSDAATPPTIIQSEDHLALTWGIARPTMGGAEPVMFMSTHSLRCSPH